MRKSLLDRLDDGLKERRESDSTRYPRVHLRVKPSSRYGGSYYLVSVGSDHIEVSADVRGKDPTLVDRGVIIEAFFG